jgi:hypothetical protein
MDDQPLGSSPPGQAPAHRHSARIAACEGAGSGLGPSERLPLGSEAIEVRALRQCSDRGPGGADSRRLPTKSTATSTRVLLNWRSPR